jgi:hypothetical protein
MGKEASRGAKEGARPRIKTKNRSAPPGSIKIRELALAHTRMLCLLVSKREHARTGNSAIPKKKI